MLQIRGHYVIRVECEYPFRGDAGLFQSEVPLIAVTVKDALHDANVVVRSGELRRVVRAEAVDDDDLIGPTQAVECARDVWRFVVREYERSDLVEHLSRGFAS